MPVGCFGGKREIMHCIAPLGPVYQAGTLSGNPLAMAAGLATLRLIKRPGFHAELSDYTSRMLQRPARARRCRRHPVRHHPGRRHVRPVLQRCRRHRHL